MHNPFVTRCIITILYETSENNVHFPKCPIISQWDNFKFSPQCPISQWVKIVTEVPVRESGLGKARGLFSQLFEHLGGLDIEG